MGVSNSYLSRTEVQQLLGIRSRISTDHGTCGSNGLPAWVNFPLYAHGDRASR